MFNKTQVSLGITALALTALTGCAGSSSSTTTTNNNPATPGPVSVQVYETTADGTNLLALQTPVTFTSAAGAGTTPIAVTPTAVLQPWDGVGGAMTDSAAVVIASLPTTQQQTVLNDLFSTTSGAGLNMVRLIMGASDFTASGNYSYDDVAAGTTDPTLAKFSIAHDQTNIIPLTIAAQTINKNLKLIAVPMSPPAWMKTTGTMNGVSGASTSTSQIITADFPYYANYFIKFLQAYNAQGLPIYAISAQNEPNNTSSGHPTAILTATDEANFIGNYLGPAMATANITSTKIFGMEDNWSDTAYAQTLLTSAATQYLAGTSFHWYAGTVNAQSTTQAVNLNKGVWFTESSGTVSCPTQTTCPTLTASTFSGSGFKTQMQQLVMGVVQNYGRSSMGWNLVLNQNEGPQNNGCYNCVGIMTVNTATSPASLYFNNTYYVLGHIGKFVTPGANVISTTQGSTTGVQTVGFANPDGSLVLVAFNNSSTSTVITVTWKSQTFDYTLPGGAAATFKWSPS